MKIFLQPPSSLLSLMCLVCLFVCQTSMAQFDLSTVDPDDIDFSQMVDDDQIVSPTSSDGDLKDVPDQGTTSTSHTSTSPTICDSDSEIISNCGDNFISWEAMPNVLVYQVRVCLSDETNCTLLPKRPELQVDSVDIANVPGIEDAIHSGTAFLWIIGQVTSLSIDSCDEYHLYANLMYCTTLHTRPTIAGIAAEELVPGKGSYERIAEKSVHVNIMPNPFQNDVQINYELTKSEPISITLYQANGQQVATILPKQFVREGTYAIRYTGVALPKGLYYCSIQTPTQTITRKIIKLQ